MTARILVVDDIPANVKLLEAKLSAEYYDVIPAADGPQALEVAREQAPDIILLDVMMPGMDGFEVCERLKADAGTAHIPVVMVTALSEISDRVRGLEAGADDFLSKPVNDTALFARVRSLVRLKMMMDELRVRQETSGQLGVADAGDDLDDAPARILTVESSEYTAERTCKYLREAGHTVDHVDTGRAGLEQGREGGYDLIIVGIDLKGEDGLRLCSQFRSQEETRHVPLLLLLDDMDLPRLAKGLDLGVTDYLVKPLDRGELLARARTQVRRRRYHDRLRARIQKSVSMAFTDALTGLYNRRYLTTHLDRKLMGIGATGKPVAVAILDVDHFKQINDTYGHNAGDEVLQQLATALQDNLRSVDLVARYGGEEFVIVMPDTGSDAAQCVAERVRGRVVENEFRVAGGETSLPVTVSIGVAATTNAEEMAEDVLDRADQALYRAKSEGRNRVVSADGTEVLSPEAVKTGL
ncbi:PleD family two-component system response regulator [Ferruginivarius sediminum]|uniref:diguanylate cyclase n=1 Tax=Ferruginivarius sediminum TaxID=2661937 RepID=A0A369TBQ3_9PROT|nr:PleD family two-component system response regulator [Ferruginivarius sediminum]RDD62743.1 PleD family two-component system response regulator [Ferruginivarius sediminum]